MIDVWIDLLAILASFWEPNWGHVGTIFVKTGRRLWDSALFFVALVFFSAFPAILTPSWRHFGAPGPHLGSILEMFGPILAPCWCQVGAILGHLGARACTGLAPF